MRFVLRYTGFGTKPEDIAARLVAVIPVAKIIDESSRMVLIEAPESSESVLRKNLPDWIVAPQVNYSIPRPPVQKVQIG